MQKNAPQPLGLSLATLSELPADIARPCYQRSALTPGIVHIGLGNFHRAHQAWYLHRLMQAGQAFDWAILGAGVRTFDAAFGGLSGCPYAPGASGNLATEDLVYMLEGMGYETGVDLGRLVDITTQTSQLVGRSLPSKVWQAELGARAKRGRAAARKSAS